MMTRSFDESKEAGLGTLLTIDKLIQGQVAGLHTFSSLILHCVRSADPTMSSARAATSPSKDDTEVTTTIKATAHLSLPAHPRPLSYAELNPRSEPTEFYGPWGMLVVLTFTPTIAYALFYLCNETTGCPPRSARGWDTLVRLLGDWPATNGQLWDSKAVVVYFTFFAYLIACWALIPVQRTQGTLIRDGTRKMYKLNGESCAVVCASFPWVVRHFPRSSRRRDSADDRGAEQ